MNGEQREEEMRKELIGDYFLEISELIGSEKMQTRIAFINDDLYNAKVELDFSKVGEEEDWDHILSGLRSIIRRITILERSQIKVSVDLLGLRRNK